jgi:hypothetical protein
MNELDFKTFCWPLPKGDSANKSLPLVQRKSAYFESCNRFVNGNLVYPNDETIGLILDAYDMFNASLTVSPDSFFYASTLTENPD